MHFHGFYTIDQQRHNQGKEWLRKHENILWYFDLADLINIFVESTCEFLSFVLPIFMIIFGRISQIFNSQFKALSQVHWLSYIKIFCLKFPCYWQQISKNTSSYNQVDNQFKIINKFKKRLCFG